MRPSIYMRLTLTVSAFAFLTACDTLPDFDLRDLGDGFDTSAAVANLPDRPTPDARGVITYPNYQVVVANRGDTIRSIATRLGVETDTLAAFNGIAPDTPLRAEELVALPGQVSAGTPNADATAPLDIAAVATTALDRADANAPQIERDPAPVQGGIEPIRHKVARGETVFSISRLYNVPVRNIAEWNGLGPDLNIREGQFILVPQGLVTSPETQAVTDPGEGTQTPVPPSATTPLPSETPSAAAVSEPAPEAPDIGTATVADTSAARLQFPVQGSIIRDYAPGRNDGIDIGVPAGTPVKAAGSGSIAAITTDTNGVAIVVIRHSDGLLTVYTNLDGLTVAKNDSVAAGQTIGKVRDGNPSFLHFEVRRGLQSVDPNDFLP